jgi:NDP-sugar pyrophosphorylase family protein
MDKCARKITKGFIMAAGRGTRFLPYSKAIPKTMLAVDGEPLIVRNALLLDRAFDLDILYVLVGHKSELLRQALSQVKSLKAKIEFIVIPDEQISGGLLAGFAAVVPYLEKEELFVAVLGDEYYGGQDHQAFAGFVQSYPDFYVCCGVKKYGFPDEYFNNYSVDFDANTKIIKQVQEKPASITSPYFGLGIICAKRRLAELAQEHINLPERTNLINLFNIIAGQGAGPVVGYEFYDSYVNINNRSDVYKMKRSIRQKRWKDFKIDVIIPAWNEVESIAYVVKDFLPVAHQVIVMDNHSADGTAQAARAAGAKVYSEPLSGYGDAIKKGLDRSNADILVVAEADGTFRAEDLEKMLQYIKNADAVIGTRTYWQYIEYGANMPFLQRMSNIVFGGIITLLWWNRKSRFTDVGCTFRCLWRESYQKISDSLIGSGPEFSPEMIIELLNSWQRVIEVPVPYHARIMGKSKFSNSFFASARTALKMLRLILFKRYNSWFNNLVALKGLWLKKD